MELLQALHISKSNGGPRPQNVIDLHHIIVQLWVPCTPIVRKNCIIIKIISLADCNQLQVCNKMIYYVSEWVRQ